MKRPKVQAVNTAGQEVPGGAGTSLKAWSLFAALFLAPYLLFAAYFPYFGTDIAYLRGDGPRWMLNPEDNPTVDGFPVDFPGLYERRFDIPGPPKSAVLRLTATGSQALTVNGRQLSTEEETSGRNWKSPVEYDISGYLAPGQNELSVYVHSPYTKTALRAQGNVVTEGGTEVSLDSGPEWKVRSVKPSPVTPVSFQPVTPVFNDHVSFAEKIRRGQYWPGSLALFGGGALVLAASFFLGGPLRSLDAGAGRLMRGLMDNPGAKRAAYIAATATIFAASAAVLWHNMLRYPYARTGDTVFHLAYFEHFLESWRVPLASEGFQMYNPPVFYLLPAVLFRAFGPAGWLQDVANYAQMVNTVSAFLMLVVVFLILRRLTDERPVQLAALVMAAFLPIQIYKAPAISGDSLASLFITLMFYYFLVYIQGPGRGPALLAGLATGLALLTRYTGLFAMLGLMAGFAYTVWREQDKRERLYGLAVYVSSAAAVSGWYYLRNLVVLHRLLPMNGTKEFFYFRQAPGFRDWDFYSSAAGLLVNNPLGKENVITSFLAGSYSTFWYDGYRLFVNIRDYVPVFALLALSLFPTVLIVRGMLKASERCFDAGGRDALAPFMLALLLAWGLALFAYLLGSYTYPFYSSMKAHYLLCCIAPVACFLAMGVKAWTARSGWIVGTLWTAGFVFYVTRVFWL